MNILIETIHSPYSGGRVGGAETSLRLIAEKMTENGHTVFFITKQQSKTLFGYSRKKIDGVEVITYSKFKFGILNRVRVKRILASLKTKHHKFLIKKNKVEIVHTYYNFSLLRKYVCFKKELDFKLIVRIAGLKLFEEIEKEGFRKKDQYVELFNKVDQFNFISKGLFDLFHLKMKEYDFDFRFNNYFIKDIGVNLNKEIHLKDIIISKKRLDIVMVARFSDYQKRQDILVDAIAKLKNHNIHLTLIGEGPNKRILKKQVEFLEIQEFISFKPFVKKEILWDNLKHYDLLVHACEYEGLSKMIIESMAYGLPVLVSDVSPLNTYIKDEQNGFLVANDISAWAQKIEKLYLNQSLFPNVIKNANHFIVKNYNADENVFIYENYFQTTLN
ncbi:glycosyltransferase family 4 protein [Bizionia myxarmorum]|uniref:Glycosyltransferase family 4 protein n=1 Tax=Bizionia myxarmorum TaxID=291186 RepID=A0A5D0R8I7_9FLAO|nr:glycosyltransferase family 4 protein [Bizionia myxarmorum]TYB76998.1 glycosyltransferase family 4 protein [Bizionia myxarmorum]